MVQTPEEKPLTPGAVADMFNVSLQTVAAWAEAGKLPSFRTPGNHRRFWRADVERFRRGDDAPTAADSESVA